MDKVLAYMIVVDPKNDGLTFLRQSQEQAEEVMQSYIDMGYDVDLIPLSQTTAGAGQEIEDRPIHYGSHIFYDGEKWWSAGALRGERVRLVWAGYVLAMDLLQSDRYINADEELREAVRLFTDLYHSNYAGDTYMERMEIMYVNFEPIAGRHAEPLYMANEEDWVNDGLEHLRKEPGWQRCLVVPIAEQS